MKNIFKGHNAALVNHLFQILLVTYLILLLVEQIWSGVVSTYLNLNYLLIIVIVIGVLDVFSEHPEKEPEKIKARDYIFISILGIAGFIIIKFKTVELGGLSWLISIIAGILIILLSILVLSEDEEPEKPKNSTKKSKKNQLLFWIMGILLIVVILNIISILITGFTDLRYLEALRIVFGSVYVLFLPGFIMSYIFFPKTKEFDSEKKQEEIDWIERIALSFALSIAVVPLIVFYLNLVGVKINILNTSLTIFGIIAISTIILLIKNKNIVGK